MVLVMEDLVTRRCKDVGVGDIFKVVVQVVLLFCLETWVMEPYIGRALGIFQNRVNHRLTERHPRRLWGGSWDYPPLEEVME